MEKLRSAEEPMAIQIMLVFLVKELVLHLNLTSEVILWPAVLKQSNIAVYTLKLVTL